MKSPPYQSNSEEDLESAASAVVGKIVCAFSRLEFNLGLCLRGAVGSSDIDAVSPLVERLTFKNKIDALLEVIERRFSSNDACVADFKQWQRRVDEVRSKRNSFIDGRWGIHTSAHEVINVAPGLPGPAPQRETPFTLIDLERELFEIHDVSTQFNQLREKWHL